MPKLALLGEEGGGGEVVQLLMLMMMMMCLGRKQVQEFYDAALKAGGKDNGAPGERFYHAGYYAAFVRSPAGHNVEAVIRGADLE